jgi:sarcosine oxidase/L-pipecolate oxidase
MGITPSTANGHPGSLVIVGAGVFGLSTALHFKRSHPDATVTVIDRIRENRGGASSDLNKIVRADYPDPIYMRLAIEAQERWRNDPIFKPHYHECGMLFAEEINMGRDSHANYRKLGQEALSGALLSVEEARARFPIFQDANWTDTEYNYYNPHSGWGEAEEAMHSTFEAALAAGVVFVEATVQKLHLGADRSCLGVTVLKDGKMVQILGDRTVVCTGAYTEKLLADTAPEWKELQVDGRMVAAAAVQCQASYPPDQEEKLQQAPVHFIGMWHTHGASILAPKCWC